MLQKKVVVLEDDPTMAEAIKNAAQKVGYEVFVTSRTSEAEQFFDKNKVFLLIADCLLPGESGLEFVNRIRKKMPTDSLEIVMMSGVMTDPSFIKDTIRSSGIKGFLKKPFDMSELLRFLPTLEVVQNEEELHPRQILYQLRSNARMSEREKKKFLENLEEIHGFDLPYIFNLMVDSKISGHLNIINEKGEVSGISLSRGSIVHVDVVDEKTFIGVLLIESGYIISEDLEYALNIKNQKRIGEKLIQNNLLSPHAFDIVLSHQMNLRLSSTIVNEMVKFNFVQADVDLTSPYLDRNMFNQFLHDWIAGNISFEWLKAHFLQWSNSLVIKGSDFESDGLILKMPILSKLSGFVDFALTGKKLSEIIDSKKFPEEPLYKALLLLLTKNYINFEFVKEVSNEVHLKTLKNILNQFNQKNDYEVFELMVQMVGASDSNPPLVYKEFLKLISNHNQAMDTTIKELQNRLEKIAKDAFTSMSSENREAIKAKQVQGDIEQKLKAMSLFDEAKILLNKGHFFQAKTLIDQAQKLDPKLTKIRLYATWSRLGLLEVAGVGGAGVNKATLAEIELELTQVSPEEKYDALYNFVMGLFYRIKGDINTARKFIDKALSLDNTLVVAKRELGTLNNLVVPKKDVFQKDLKDLVGSLFKKSGS